MITSVMFLTVHGNLHRACVMEEQSVIMSYEFDWYKIIVFLIAGVLMVQSAMYRMFM